MDQYLQAKKQIIEYFGLPEELHHVPIIDNRDYFWMLTNYYGILQLSCDRTDDVPIMARISKNKNENKDYECFYIYDDVYQKCEYSLLHTVTVDPGLGIQKYLRIFDNSKQITQLE